MSEFIIPNLGDGVAQGDVLKVLVKAGDALKVDQPVLELETDKATIEVPSNVAGTVREIKVKAGDRVKPGQAVLVLDGANGASGASVPKEGAQEPPKQDATAPASASAREDSGELRRDLAGAASGREGGPADKSSEDLKAEAMANSTVQAVLEIFPVDKTTIEER